MKKYGRWPWVLITLLLAMVLVAMLLSGGAQGQEYDNHIYLPVGLRRYSPPLQCSLFYWLDASCAGYWHSCVVRWMAYTWPEQCPDIQSFRVFGLFKEMPWSLPLEWPLPDCCTDLDSPDCCVTKCLADTYGVCETFLDQTGYYAFGVYARIPGYYVTPLGWTDWELVQAGSNLCYACDEPYSIQGARRNVNHLFRSPTDNN